MLDWKDTLRCDMTEQGPLKRRGCKHRALQQASILLGCPQHSALTPSYTVDNWRREQANSLDSAVNLNYYKHQSYCDVHLTQQKPKKAKQKTRGQTQVWVYPQRQSEKSEGDETHLSCHQVFAVRGKRQSCDGFPVRRTEDNITAWLVQCCSASVKTVLVGDSPWSVDNVVLPVLFGVQ